jgi:hypothetical protein
LLNKTVDAFELLRQFENGTYSELIHFFLSTVKTPKQRLGVQTKKPFYTMVQITLMVTFGREGGIGGILSPAKFVCIPWNSNKKLSEIDLFYGIKIKNLK